MNNDQYHIITQAIEEKLGPRQLVCPISGDEASWSILIKTTAMPALDVPGVVPMANESQYPMAVVMCEHCGYTFFVNLIQLGIAPSLDLPVESS